MQHMLEPRGGAAQHLGWAILRGPRPPLTPASPPSPTPPNTLHPLQCHNLTVRAKGEQLLGNCTFTIAAGRRYGLVGPNG